MVQAQWDNDNATKNGDYLGSCRPFGWIRSFTPHPMQILQNSENIAFLFELRLHSIWGRLKVDTTREWSG
jgi:hypothetical protein